MFSEKSILIGIFSIIFVSSTVLFYLMIKKDQLTKNQLDNRINSSGKRLDNGKENVWPKVEIDVRK